MNPCKNSERAIHNFRRDPEDRTKPMLEFAESVSSLPQDQWNACAGVDNPFVSHEFLSALELSGCVGEGTGWFPRPLVARDANGRIIGAVPCYLKLHSQGEYIFDYHWADAYHRLMPPGSNYYPKLQVAVPFTPVPGPRLLLHPDVDEALRTELFRSLIQRMSEENCSSVHITFCSQKEYLDGQTLDYLPRLGEQYHWFNQGYRNFEDFLADLTSRKRKTIKKERQAAQTHDLKIETLHGDELTESQLRAFFRMYQHTSLRKWGDPYLNLEFFQLLSQTMPRRLVFVLATPDGSEQPVAGAWNLRGEKALFGRNWGALERFDLLHFEVCYYRAIDYAIANGLERVEAGAQGTHKIQRGYRPTPVYSLHHIEAPSFRGAIEQYLSAEREEIEYRLEALKTLEPFRRSFSAPSEGTQEKS